MTCWPTEDEKDDDDDDDKTVFAALLGRLGGGCR